MQLGVSADYVRFHIILALKFFTVLKEQSYEIFISGFSSNVTPWAAVSHSKAFL
jgi:hypothetical protein